MNTDLDGFVLEAQAVEGVDRLLGVLRPMIVDKAIAQTLAYNKSETRKSNNIKKSTKDPIIIRIEIYTGYQATGDQRAPSISAAPSGGR